MNVDRRRFLKFIGFSGISLAVGGCGGFHRSSSLKKPNIVLILADDQGWGDLSINGNVNLSTPNIDSLARDGVSFDRFFVCPVCAPTRAEFLTGRYHLRSGVHGVSRGAERMNLDEKTVGDAFVAQGYATGAFGKWHNGMQYPYHPNGRGFQEFYGFCSGHWGNYFSPMLEHNGRIVKGEGFIIDDLTDKAMEFMESNAKASKPFLAYLPYNTPHSPMQVPDRFWEKFADKELQMRNRDFGKENIDHTRAALAMCENIDWNVGRILKQLKKLKLTDDTIVIYFSDNGPNGWRWNGGMKGKKGSTDEGGVRSPLLVKWPGTIEAGKTIDRIASAIDLLPTLVELTGICTVGDKPLDGISLAPLLTGSAENWPDRMIFSHWAGRVSVRSQRFRMDNKGKLYDMVNDEGQRQDVSQKKPDVTEKLKRSIENFKQTLLEEPHPDKRPFIVGHPDFRFTQLPARDAVAHGKIKRARHANCSFYTNWANVKDYISWDVEVASTGDYKVEIYYTCPEDAVGSIIELSFNESALQGTIADAHNPPLSGAENDRVKRVEAYVKDFKPMHLGRIHLKKGKGQLMLRSLKKTGLHVMDFRLIMLEKLANRSI